MATRKMGLRGLVVSLLLTLLAGCGLLFIPPEEGQDSPFSDYDDYDDLADMKLSVSFDRGAYLPALTRCMYVVISPRDDWNSDDDPCPRLPGLRVTVDGMELEGPYRFLPDEPVRCAQITTLYCPPIELVDAPEELLASLVFSYHEQTASLAIQDPWSAPYWRLVSPQDEIHGQIVVSPGDTLAFELSYGQNLVENIEMIVKAYFAVADVQSSKDEYLERYVSHRYDMEAGQYLLEIAADAEVGVSMALDLIVHLPSTASGCQGWNVCEVGDYTVGKSLDLVVR